MGAIGGMVDNTLGTNIFGGNANEQALQAQTGANQQAMGTLAGAYNDTKAQLQPWQTAGTSALAMLAGGNLMDGYKASDAYKFQLAEGQKAINNGMAARGMGKSGAALQELTKYSQGLASQDAQQFYNNQFNRLNTLAGYGSNASNNMANAATGYGANIAGLQTGLGNAQAGAAMGRANQTQNGIQQGTAIASMLFSDENLKKDFKDISQEDLVEMKRMLKACFFKYKSEEHGKGEWIGVRAQDLKKSKFGSYLIIKDEKGRLQIDKNKVLSMFLATLAESEAA